MEREHAVREWWRDIQFSDGDATDWFLRSVFGSAAESGQTIYTLYRRCYLPLHELHEFIISTGRRMLLHSVNPFGQSDDENALTVERTYVSAETVLSVNHAASGEVGCDVASLDGEFVEALRTFLLEKGTARPRRGQVFVIVKSREGFELAQLGKISAPLERENYTDEVLAQYDHVREDLESETPCGRLILLDGEPGTGKSFLIKALASEVKARFVLVPSLLVGSLSAPELIQVILAPGLRHMPTVLLLEDADASLIPRGTDNLDKISDVLNAGDGILGELADLRVIATTNANRLEVDPALLRAGRLCSYIHLERLTAEHAARIYSRLKGRAGGDIGHRTLAEVYRAAHGGGWMPTRKGDGVGFLDRATQPS